MSWRGQTGGHPGGYFATHADSNCGGLDPEKGQLIVANGVFFGRMQK